PILSPSLRRHDEGGRAESAAPRGSTNALFFFKQKSAYEFGLGIPAEPLFRSMIGVSNLQSFIASMTQKLTLSDISDESKNYLDKAGITTACLRIKSKWTAGGK